MTEEIQKVIAKEVLRQSHRSEKKPVKKVTAIVAVENIKTSLEIQSTW